jgi:predicted nucleic acid-binding protein
MTVFADTLYWYAIANTRDEWGLPGGLARMRLKKVRTVTTDEALIEFLTAMSGGDPHLRQTAVDLTREIMADEIITVIPQTRFTFLRGLDLYEKRQDKKYSLTDRVSMIAMRDENITDILTNDRHFDQEGFRVLI